MAQRINPYDLVERIAEQVADHWTSHDQQTFLEVLFDRLATDSVSELKTAITAAATAVDDAGIE